METTELTKIKACDCYVLGFLGQKQLTQLTDEEEIVLLEFLHILLPELLTMNWAPLEVLGLKFLNVFLKGTIKIIKDGN